MIITSILARRGEKDDAFGSLLGVGDLAPRQRNGSRPRYAVTRAGARTHQSHTKRARWCTMVRTRRATAQSEREDGGRIPDGADVREAPCEGAMRAERPPQRRSAITACSRITSVFRPHAQGRGVAAPVAHAMRPGQRRRPRMLLPLAIARRGVAASRPRAPTARSSMTQAIGVAAFGTSCPKL